MRRSSVVIAAVALAAPSLAQVPADIPDALAGRLVQLEGGRLAAATLPGTPRRIAFYFGAGWCGPCRAFVPELRAAYPRLRANGVAVMFVSDDAGCGAMRDYVVAARMPWPVVECRSRGRIAWIQRARGAALPGFLVYDPAGRLIETSWSATGRSRPRAVLDRLMAIGAPPPR